MTSRKRTHKRAGSYTFTPTAFQRIGPLISCPECGGNGFRLSYHTYAPIYNAPVRERRETCWLCKGSGVACEGAMVRTGPDRIRHRSLCSNTGYANPDTLQTSEDWNAVDCPACLQAIWLGKVPDRKAVILHVEPCSVAAHGNPAYGHAPHIRYINHGFREEFKYCPGRMPEHVHAWTDADSGDPDYRKCSYCGETFRVWALPIRPCGRLFLGNQTPESHIYGDATGAYYCNGPHERFIKNA